MAQVQDDLDFERKFTHLIRSERVVVGLILFLVSEFLKSSLTFLVFYISLQINCCGRFLCFFLSHSLARHKNPLEIFPYGAPPSPLEN